MGRQEDEMKKTLEELEKLKEQLVKTEKTKKDLEEQNVGLLQSKNDLFFQLQVRNYFSSVSDLMQTKNVHTLFAAMMYTMSLFWNKF